MRYKLTQALRDYLLAKGWIKAADASEDDVRSVVDAHVEDGSLPLSKVADLVDGGGIRNIVKDAVNDAINPTPTGPDPKKVFGGGVSGGIVRKASERYGTTTKTVGRHVSTKQPVLNPLTGQEAQHLSGGERALAGAWWKWSGRKAGLPCLWTEHDQDLFNELLAEGSFVGEVNGVWHENFSGADRIKAVLDDSVSGGINIAPVVIDSDIVTQLLLGSEIFPFVDVKDMPTGRRIEVPTMGAVSVSWGTPEGTSLPLFDTTGLLSTIPATVNTVAAAVEVGRDLLMNSAIEVGQALETSIGQSITQELDRVIVLGDGTVQPLGIFNTPGIATVASASGAAGPVTLGDLEALMFGLPKQYRAPNLSPAIVGNDTLYRRFRGIPVATTYNTRALGEDYMAYTALGWPFRINNQIPSNKAAFVALKKYRLWRRKGFEPRWVTEGKELALKNLNLLIVRGLYAGRLLDPSAAVISVDLQT